MKINGEKVGVFESQAGSIVTSLGIEEDDVHSITLESVGLHKDEWISLLEVSWHSPVDTTQYCATSRGENNFQVLRFTFNLVAR